MITILQCSVLSKVIVIFQRSPYPIALTDVILGIVEFGVLISHFVNRSLYLLSISSHTSE